MNAATHRVLCISLAGCMWLAGLLTANAQSDIQILPDTPDWIFSPTNSSSYFGYVVDSAGDVNGDGYDDVVVGTRNGNRGVFAFYGAPNGLSTNVDWAYNPEVPSSWLLGRTLAGGGDVDGDGFDDLLIGATGRLGASGDGYAYLVYGSETGLTNSAAWMASGGGEAGDLEKGFGVSLDFAGDINRDGFDDVIIGASSYPNTSGGEGQAFVFYGSETGLATTADVVLNGTSNEDTRFGTDVSAAGDVNGDGYDDVIVGEPFYRTLKGITDPSNGRVYIYAGSSNGLITTPLTTIDGEYSRFSGSTFFGWHLTAAGDVNGDGYDDILVAAKQINLTAANSFEGRVYAFLGGASVDYTNATEAQWQYDGDFKRFLGNVVAGGDANGDGYSDVMLGQYGPLGSRTAHYRVFPGSPAGLASSAAWSWTNRLDSVIRMTGAFAGDINRDRNDDLIIGNAYWDVPLPGLENNEGDAIVFYGITSHTLSGVILEVR